LTGASGNNLEELIRATMQIATQLGGTDLKATLDNLSQASTNISQLTKDTRVALKDISGAARSVTQLSLDTRQQLRQFGAAAESVTAAAQQFNQLGGEVNTLVKGNKGTLVASLQNLQETSQELKGVVTRLSPLLSRVEQGQLLDNLETLAANGALASEALKGLATDENNPATVVELRQTLQSAQETLNNASQITSDLKTITGNEEVRQNLIRLINGLGKLFSSSQALEQQMQATQEFPRPSAFSSLEPQSALSQERPIPTSP